MGKGISEWGAICAILGVIHSIVFGHTIGFLLLLIGIVLIIYGLLR